MMYGLWADMDGYVGIINGMVWHMYDLWMNYGWRIDVRDGLCDGLWMSCKCSYRMVYGLMCGYR